jgi:hypothetical protein
MDFLTGFACILPLLVPAVIGFAIWMGVKQGNAAKAKVAELAQVLADAGYTKSAVEPWYTTQVGDKQVWVKATPTAGYRVIGDGPNSLKLGRTLVCLVPVQHLPIGGMVYPARGHHDDPDFGTAFVTVGVDTSALSEDSKAALMDSLGPGRPDMELGDHNANGLFPPAGVFTGGMLLRSSSQVSEPTEVQAWLEDVVALALRIEG